MTYSTYATRNSVADMNSMKLRNYVLTSYEPDNYENWKLLSKDKRLTFLTYQQETCPSTSKKHLQAYVEFNTQMRYSAMKKLFTDKGLHIEPRRGTREQAMDYCSKDSETLKKYPKWAAHGIRCADTEVVTIGEMDRKGPGYRSDLKSVAKEIQQGATAKDIYLRHPGVYLKYARHIKRLIYDKRIFDLDKTKRWKPSPIHIIWGDAGTGKDTFCYDKHGDDVYELQMDANKALWFDGYNGEKTLLISDFYGGMLPSVLLNLTAGRPYRLNTKGGNELGIFTTVYITSNDHPDTWYTDGLSNAFKSRVKSVQHFVCNDKSNYELPQQTTVVRQNYRKLAMAAQTNLDDFVSVGATVLPPTSETETDSAPTAQSDGLIWDSMSDAEFKAAVSEKIARRERSEQES